MRREWLTGLTRLGGICALMIGVLAMAGCQAPTLDPTTLRQGHNLPDLHHLPWPSGYYSDAAWSPNGRWIAVLAGDDYAGSHLEVLSPDGKYHRWLTAWGCGNLGFFTFAWLPDSALSCMTDSGHLIIGSYPFTDPHTVAMNTALAAGHEGAAWLAQGPTLIVSSVTDPSDPSHEVSNGRLYAVRRDGTVLLQALTPKSDDVTRPDAAPHDQGQGTAITYVLQVSTGLGTWHLDLLLSKLTMTAAGVPQLETTRAQTLATDVDDHYTWAPSGHWIAVRHLGYQGGDKIYLLNPAHPAQTVDIVLADQVGQQMMNPIWSPDGKTLIVFSVGFNSSQPYAIT
ncbi:MAG TPA: hypothetical protein VF040_19035, partial [Ktedonobacterales bacterium]